MASRLRVLLEKPFGEWSVYKTLIVLSACALLGLTLECRPGRAQTGSSHPPVISTTTDWTLDVPQLVSTTAGGTPANTFSLHANFSPDGTHLLFWSGATNFVSGTGSNEQLYLKDLTTGNLTLVSANANNVPGNDMSFNPNNSCQVLMFSPDGTKVVFESAATNLLLSGPTNGHIQIFIKDLMSGAVTLVSSDAGGSQGTNDSSNFTFSPDGTKVAFGSMATNLLASPTHTSNIFIKDLGSGQVTLVSADAGGNEGNGASSLPVFSPDGTQVAFVSASMNLTGDITNGVPEIFVKSLLTGNVTLVSMSATGTPSNSPSTLPMFSPDGAKVAFNSASNNLVLNAAGNSEIYVKDLASGAITLVSTDANGNAATSNDSQLAVFSPDGTKIGFESSAMNLVPGGTTGEQVFVKDLLSGAVTLASTDATGAQGNSPSSDPNFSPDHKKLAFQSMANNLGVTNGTFEIFNRPIFTASGAVVDNPSVATLATAGQLSFSDPDTGDTHTASVASQPGNLGALNAGVSKDTTGTGTGGVITWNYQVDETQIRALSAAATDTFALTLTDSQGCTATTSIVVTVLPHDFSVVTTSSGGAPASAPTSSCPTLVVTTSPSNLTVTAGQPASFSAAASGTPTPTVQWQVSMDGGTTFNDIPGANSTTLTFTATLAQNGNLYHAVFTNSSGSVTSSAATLTVTSSATTTALASSQNPSVFGQAVTFSATVSSSAGTPTGTVTFLDGAAAIGTGTLDASGSTSLTTPSLAVGTHTITASYGGDSTFSASTSSPLSQVVSKDAGTVTLSSSANPSVFGQGVSFTAMVTAAAPGAGTPTGTITFQDGTTTLATVNLTNGQASFPTSSLAVGAHAITATYNGDGNFNTASAAFSQTVNKDASSVTLSSSANPSVFGQPVVVSATVSAAAPGAGTPTGTVAFQDGSTNLGTANLTNGQASLTLSALSVGSHSLTATYNGDGNFNSSMSTIAQTVNKASTTTTLNSSASLATINQAVTFTATVSVVAPGAGTPTGTVTFNDGATALATVPLNSNGTAIFTTSALAALSHSITAVYSGDGNFNGSTGGLTQNVQYSICVLYDQTRSVHQKGTFPIKIYLCDFAGNDVSASSIVVHATAVTTVSGFVGIPQPPGSANPDNDFRFDSDLGPSGGYIFNLDTAGLAQGTYSLQFMAGTDPVPHTVQFGVH